MRHLCNAVTHVVKRAARDLRILQIAGTAAILIADPLQWWSGVELVLNQEAIAHHDTDTFNFSARDIALAIIQL